MATQQHLCRCLGTKHPAFTNCVGCGFIFCVEDEGCAREQGCFVCKSPVEGPLSAAQIRQTCDDPATVRAYELKDKLLQFDLENAKRTHVLDAQADYYETTVWLTEEEKAAIDERQRVRREKLLPSSRRSYLTVNIHGGGRATAVASFRRTVTEGEDEEEEEFATQGCGLHSEDTPPVPNESLLANENRVGGVYRLLLERRAKA